MANPDSINLAFNAIQSLNQIGQSLRSSATSNLQLLNKINSLVTNTTKKAILTDGLDGLNVSPTELKTKKDILEDVCNYALTKIAKLTE